MKGHRRGQSLVELALTLPIMLSVIMGVIDLSMVMYASIQVAAASREGARAGSLYAGDLSLLAGRNDADRLRAIKAAVYNPDVGTSMGMLRLALPNFDVDTDVQVTYYPSTAGSATRSGDDLAVIVSYRQPLWFDLLPGEVLGALRVSTTTRMRIQ